MRDIFLPFEFDFKFTNPKVSAFETKRGLTTNANPSIFFTSWS